MVLWEPQLSLLELDPDGIWLVILCNVIIKGGSTWNDEKDNEKTWVHVISSIPFNFVYDDDNIIWGVRIGLYCMSERQLQSLSNISK